MRNKTRERSFSLLRPEALEAREAPTVTPWAAEPFDKPAGALPAGWSQWSSTGDTAFAVSPARPLHGAGALALTANLSTLAARSWLGAAVPADAQVSAAVYVDTLIPAQILARGRSLDTARPTYYALSLARGLDAQLVRVVDGVATPLATLRSANWFSDKWVVATLDVEGKSVRGRVYRPDTDQYLNAKGEWQASPAWALDVGDTAIGGAGQAGLGRPGSYTGTVTFDDFAVALVDNVDPAQSFDATAAGSLPSGWSQWASNSGAAAVSAARAQSAPNGLALTGPSSLSSVRAWPATTALADVQAAASVYVDSLVPAQVFGRGTNLTGSAPRYYAAAVNRGLQVQLVRVRDGATTVLGDITSKQWTTDLWVRVTLYVNGTNVRAQVYRPDRSQYLSNTGLWQDTPTWALNLTDTALTSAGQAGVARPASYTGTVAFDDFALAPAVGDNQAPAVTLVAPAAGAVLSGVTRVQANASDNVGVVRVELYVDGALRAVAAAAPYAWDVDTRALPNGAHAIDVIAYDANGNVARASTLVTSANDQTVPDPTIPRHYSHIRIAELAYRGNPLGATEAALLRDSVDLVIADASLLSGLARLASTTPRLVYTNASNLYLDRLTDWLAYADAHNASRESAFYHVTKATPFGGDSPSSQPVAWFWNVARGQTTWTDLTSQARGTTGERLAFGGLGASLVVGYPERFREVNLSLLSPAALGWSAALEYPTRVDAAGKPTAWAPLRTLTDFTFRLTVSGQVAFDPPADWKPASLNGSAPLFYVRWRTTTAGAAPVARAILGRDYVQAHGTSSGVLPAFDAAADVNHDGTLDAFEYARRAAGKDARFAYESRAFYGSYGQMRFAANPADPTFRAWAVDYHRRLLAGTPLADGLFADNSDGHAQVPATVAEPADAYAADYASLLNEMARALAPHWVLANTAGGGTVADAVAKQTTASYEEFLLRPLAHSYRQFEEVAAQVARRLALRSPAPLAVLDSLPAGGSPTDPRTQLATLAYYYLVGDPDRTFLNFFGGYDPASSWAQHWSPAAAFNVGRPSGPWSVFASGADPANAALAYRVYGRKYDNALVLYKPLSASDGRAGGPGDATATTHALGGSYRALRADGSLGPAVASVTLRNGEGAILVKTTA